jgi:quinol monooxygenase YgiN
MITQLSRYESQSGKQTVAYDAFKKMAKAVAESEPGCLMYAVTRGQVNPLEIYVYEVYEDQVAFDAHRRTEHMRELQSHFDEFLNRSSFNVEMLDEVSGFIRREVADMTGQMGE